MKPSNGATAEKNLIVTARPSESFQLDTGRHSFHFWHFGPTLLYKKKKRRLSILRQTLKIDKIVKKRGGRGHLICITAHLHTVKSVSARWHTMASPWDTKKEAGGSREEE